jgi:hypothetical protein
MIHVRGDVFEAGINPIISIKKNVLAVIGCDGFIAWIGGWCV